jgi:hypothetical protein
MRTTSLLVAAGAALALAGAATAQTTITTYDPATHTYRTTTTSGYGTYVITPSGTAARVNDSGIVTIPPPAVVAPVGTANAGGTTPFYAGNNNPFGYTGASTSRTPPVVGPGGYAGQRAAAANPGRSYGYNYLNGLYYPNYTNNSYGNRYFSR